MSKILESFGRQWQHRSLPSFDDRSCSFNSGNERCSWIRNFPLVSKKVLQNEARTNLPENCTRFPFRPASLHLKFLRQCSGKGHSNVQSFTIGKTITFIDLNGKRQAADSWKSLCQISKKRPLCTGMVVIATCLFITIFAWGKDGISLRSTQLLSPSRFCLHLCKWTPFSSWWLRRPTENFDDRTNHLLVAQVGVKISKVCKHYAKEASTSHMLVAMSRETLCQPSWWSCRWRTLARCGKLTNWVLFASNDISSDLDKLDIDSRRMDQGCITRIK